MTGSLHEAASRFKTAGPCCIALGFAVLVLLHICAVRVQSIEAQEPPLADDLDRQSLRRAIRQSLHYLERLPPDRVVGEEPRPLTARQIRNSLIAFVKLLDREECPDCWLEEIPARFDFVEADPDVLFTGYYQPVIEARLSATSEFRYPIYGVPADLIVAEQVTLTPRLEVEKTVGRIQGDRFLPYYSRREIDEMGALHGHGYELAWVKDPIDLFFLHIQGSGMLRLDNGRSVFVGYAASNGRPYRSIGKWLVEQGKIPEEDVSMQMLRRYLAEHPENRNDILAHNERYVFFRFVPEGPLGSLDVPLTPGRSIATDSRLFPKGALAFIVANEPVLDHDGRLVAWRPFSRFVLNQDTGSAIKGPRRVDLYFGGGSEAGAAAGFMNTRGRLFFVMPKRGDEVTKDQ